MRIVGSKKEDTVGMELIRSGIRRGKGTRYRYSEMADRSTGEVQKVSFSTPRRTLTGKTLMVALHPAEIASHLGDGLRVPKVVKEVYSFFFFFFFGEPVISSHG